MEIKYAGTKFYIENLHKDRKFSICTIKGCLIVKVTERNTLVFTNICYDTDNIWSVTNMDRTFIVLCTYNYIKVYNKKYKKN